MFEQVASRCGFAEGVDTDNGAIQSYVLAPETCHTGFDGDPKTLDWVRHGVTSVAYQIRGRGEVAVIGLPDGRWGERVHAVVVCEPGAVAEEELEASARSYWNVRPRAPRSPHTGLSFPPGPSTS